MDRSSKDEIPAVTRTGRISARRSRQRDWLAHCSALGVVTGLGLGFAAQVIVPLSGSHALGGEDPSTWSRLVGVVLTGVAYGAAMLVAAGLGSLVSDRSRAGRAVGLALPTVTLTVLFSWHVLGLVVRVMAGSHVTIGAVDFFINSIDHMLRAAVDGYGPHLLALTLAATVVAVATARRLRSAATRSATKRWRSAGAAGAGTVTLAALGTLPGEAPAFQTAYETTPELAFIVSVHDELGESYGVAASENGPAVHVQPGPPRSAGPLWSSVARNASGAPPNVFLLMLESVSIRHLGYMGYHRSVTPNLDRIAARSMRLMRAWTTATHSNYAQMAVLSSLFPRRGASLDVYKRIDYPRVLLHDFFHELGYETATISSQDETWQGMLRFQKTGTPTYHVHAHDHPGPFVNTGSEDVVPDHITADNAMSWISQQDDERWALYVNFQMTHFPYKLPDGTPKRYDPTDVTPGRFSYFEYAEEDVPAVVNRYDNALAYVDEQIGRLENFLRDRGLLDDTLWVITADHGEMFREHDSVVTHGKTLREGEARVPLLVHWPAKVDGGEVRTPVSSLDILPTVADLLDLPPHPAFQGTSFARAATRVARPAVFMNIQGLRSLDGVVCWPYKLVVDPWGRKVRLFDLERDPDERHDLAGERKNVALALSQTIRAQMKAQVRYHRPRNADLRAQTYAPRLISCPELSRVDPRR